jgi:hypothetical protein
VSTITAMAMFRVSLWGGGKFGWGKWLLALASTVIPGPAGFLTIFLSQDSGNRATTDMGEGVRRPFIYIYIYSSQAV